MPIALCGKIYFTQCNKIVNPDSIYLLKVKNINTRTRWEICSNLTVKTPERPDVFIVNFELI